MAEYVKSGPCEACGSSDARALYTDGTSFCFSCSTYTNTNLKERLKPRKSHERAVKIIDTTSWQYSIPKQARDWLYKYHITDAEISHYGIRWNPALTSKQWDGPTGALAMPIFENGKVVCVSYRLFDPDKTKSITLGYRSYTPLTTKPTGSYSKLVIVEDYISAIKVSRFLPCIPLLGSNLPDDAILRLSKGSTILLIWLDEDKCVTAIKIAQKARLIGLEAHTIYTEKDPKEQSEEVIRGLLLGESHVDLEV